MQKKYNVLRLGLVTAILAAMFFSTAEVFAQEDFLEGVARELVLDEKYIIFPVASEINEEESEVQVLTLEVDGEKVREFKIRLAHGEPAYWFFMETKEFRGKRATLRLCDSPMNSWTAFLPFA